MKWIINEETLRQKETGLWKSPKFYASTLPGVRYCLNLNFNEGKRAHIFLRLRLGLAKTISANVRISIRSAFKEISFDSQYTQGNTGFGGYICKRKNLFHPSKNYFVDGKITIQLEATLKVDEYQQVLPDLIPANDLLDENSNDVVLIQTNDDRELYVSFYIFTNFYSEYECFLDSQKSLNFSIIGFQGNV